VQEVPADSGNFPWYMIDGIAVLEDSYSEVVVNVIDLALKLKFTILEYTAVCVDLDRHPIATYNNI